MEFNTVPYPVRDILLFLYLRGYWRLRRWIPVSGLYCGSAAWRDIFSAVPGCDRIFGNSENITFADESVFLLYAGVLGNMDI